MSKVIVITGATNGIGLESAKQLAKQGHRLILVARSKEKVLDTLKMLHTAEGQGHSYYIADMASVPSIKKAAYEIVAAEPLIDVLINNAGAHFGEYIETEDGLEMTIAVNHLAYFVFTLCLRGSLRRGTRVVNTSSHLHRGTRFEEQNLDLRKGKHHGLWHGFDNYNRSKLYNVLFTRYLSQLWATNEGITVNCFHPGLIRSGFGTGQLGFFEPIFWLLVQLFGRTSAAGGEVLTWLATSPELEGVTGQYYNRYNLEVPSADALSFNNAKLLWDKSLEWAKMS